ncbi:MAG: GntR family transcriptional regulator [Gemmatimonadales bacterium]
MSDHDGTGLAERLAPYLNPSSGKPLHRQIVDRLWLEVVTGTLETGERLPTVRQLAVDLNVSPNTVAQAFKELESLGVVVTRRGTGSFIGLRDPDRSEVERRAQLERLCEDVASQSSALGIPLTDVVEVLDTMRSPDRDGNCSGR